MKAVIKLFVGTFFGLSGLFATGCTQNANEPEEVVEPPEIYANMPVDEAVEAAVDFGGKTLRQVKKLIKRRGESQKASAQVYSMLKDQQETLPGPKMINAMHVYLSAPFQNPLELFSVLVRSERPLSRQLAWQLAQVLNHRAMTQRIEAELTRAIERGEEDAVLLPQMATAVQAHKLESAYTLLRLGLLKTGAEEFARGMIAFRPSDSVGDLMDYLAQAEASELRQLTLSNVNLFTCLVILQHMVHTPVETSHRHLTHLFLYAVSRNSALAELAQEVLMNYVPKDKEHLAALLARHEAWVQVAYVEGARRRMSPKVGLLLTELRDVTAQRDVVEEIDGIRR